MRRRARGAATPPVADPGRGALRMERPQDQPDRHPGLRRLRERGGGRHAGGRPGGVRGQRGRRRRGADRGAVAHRRRAGPAPHGLHQQAGPGAFLVRTHPGRDPRRLRRRRRPPGAPHRRRGFLLRRGRPADRHRLHLRPGPQPAGGHRGAPLGRDPRRHGGARTPGPRQPGGGHRGGRRRSAGALPRRRDPVAGAAGAHAGPRTRRRHRVPGGVRFGHRPGGDRPPGRPGVRGGPLAARPPTGRGGGGHHPRGDLPGSGRPAPGLGVQDHRRPSRGPDLPAEGPVRDAPQRRPPGQSPFRCRRTAPRPVRPARPRTPRPGRRARR